MADKWDQYAEPAASDKWDKYAEGPADTWHEHPIRETAKGLWDTVSGAAHAMAPKSAKDYAIDALLGPAARPAAAMVESHLDQAKKAMDPSRPAVTRMGHALATVTPGGPFAAQIGETLPENPPRAVGMASTA